MFAWGAFFYSCSGKNSIYVLLRPILSVFGINSFHSTPYGRTNRIQFTQNRLRSFGKILMVDGNRRKCTLFGN